MNRFLVFILISLSILILIIGTQWFYTQPVWPIARTVEKETFEVLPVKNREVITFIEANGKKLAPTYQSAVCTEFMIKVIDKIQPLTKKEKNDIRIITNSDLNQLIELDSPIIKGVQTALIKGYKGMEIKESTKVLPGDFVQFWNVFQGKAYGHCGIVLSIDPNKTLTLYSSHPSTGGYGTQVYLWPEKTYFVRLK